MLMAQEGGQEGKSERARCSEEPTMRKEKGGLKRRRSRWTEKGSRWKRRDRRRQRTAVATAVEAHEHHFY